MNVSIEEKRKQGVKLLKDLNIYKPYINGFEKGDICYFENFGGYWAYQDEELMAKIKEIEEEYNCLVCAITHEFAEFGELYDLIVVTDYPEEWEIDRKIDNQTFSVFAYVWNKSDEDMSEFGNIGIKSFGGGIRRVY